MKKVILIIRDGWGESDIEYGNAVMAANTPNDDNYKNSYPSTILKCTGNDVGNPKTAQGGSEVGHLTLGAGRIVWQPQEMINQKIESGEFFRNIELIKAMDNCKKNNSNLHLCGLFSDAGVHSDIAHMYALMQMAKQNNINNVYLHLVLDGRDVPEKSALNYVEKLEEKIKEIGIGKIASIIGRYYAMDRDTNWDRTEEAYRLIVEGKGFEASTAKEAIEMAYARGEKTDYYIQATVIDKEGLVKTNDSFIWFNFRSDRSRQISKLFVEKETAYFVGMSKYDENLSMPIAFEPENIINNLGEVLSKNNKKQLRISETEKYAHVTFFFNSQVEKPYKNEDRIMIPSPKVPSYDLKPEMSAYEVEEKVLENIGKYDFILVNFPNPDLVGHSGIFEAVVRAVEVVDECVGKIIKKALENDYLILMGADHGNAEHMKYENGDNDASHGFNPVRYTLIGKDLDNIKLKKEGGLKDVAPTILELMDIPKPSEMTGKSLIVK